MKQVSDMRPDTSRRQQTSPTMAKAPTDSHALGIGWHALLALVFLMLLVGNNVFRKTTLAALLIIYAPFALIRLRTVLGTISKSRGMIALWIIFVASLQWSLAPLASQEVILTQSAFLVLALFMAVQHRQSGYLDALRTAAIAYVALVTLYCLVFPGSSMSSQGLKAFMPHKNTLGVMLGTCVLVLLQTPGRRKWHVAMATLTFGLLLLTRSKTAVTLVVLCNVLPVLAAWWKRTMYPSTPGLPLRKLVRHLLTATFVLAVGLLVIFRDELLLYALQHLPKEALTGRGALWQIVIQQLRAHSLLGIGPGTFWQAGAASEIARTWAFEMDPNWIQRMISADGSYLDLIASIGVLGLGLFLLTTIEIFARLFSTWLYQDTKILIVLTVYSLLQAVTESTLLYSTNLLWLLYLLNYFTATIRSIELSAARINI